MAAAPATALPAAPLRKPRRSTEFFFDISLLFRFRDLRNFNTRGSAEFLDQSRGCFLRRLAAGGSTALTHREIVRREALLVGGTDVPALVGQKLDNAVGAPASSAVQRGFALVRRGL